MRKLLWIGGVVWGLCFLAGSQIQFGQAQAPEKETRQPNEKAKPRPPAKKGGPPREDEVAANKRGVVQEFHQSPKGEIDGLTLEDGTEVRFPPHFGKQVTEIIALKDEIQVDGHKHTGPKGDTHLRAEAIKNLKSSKALEIDSMPPKDQEMLNEVRAIRALLEGPTTSPSEVKNEQVEGGPHDRILFELRELRKIVEQRVAKDK